MKRVEDFKEVIAHRRAYFQTARSLGAMKFRFYFHDLEKAILILVAGDKIATNMHRAVSSHHDRNSRIKDILGAIIDWECARVTKPSKPLNARQTLAKWYAHLDNYNRFIQVLDELGL